MTPTKQCFKCHAVLSLADFYKHPETSDGYLGKCKKCTRLDVRKNRKKKRVYYNAYDRERYATGDHKKIQDPIKQACRRVTHKAIAMGILVKPKRCQRCGMLKRKPLDAHHHDYTKPLEVVFVCRPCHGAIHAIEGDLRKLAKG